MVRHIPESRLGILTASRFIEQILYGQRTLDWVRILQMSGRQFRSVQEAKEFIAAGIAGQAQRGAVPFSDVERKMLLFSEVG